MAVTFRGQISVIRMDDREEDRSDFRDVPKSDRGNDGYQDRGMLGNYSPDAEPFRTPDEVKFDTGYGADKADLERGWCDAGILEDPAYDKGNYQDRSTQPKLPDEDQLNTNIMGKDWAFRSRNTRSRGFLPRPRIPTERN